MSTRRRRARQMMMALRNDANYLANATKLASSNRAQWRAKKQAHLCVSYTSIQPIGTAGVAASIVMVSSNVLQLISSYLIMRDLHLFRQCCHASCKAVTLYVRAPADHGGMAARYWEKLRREPHTRPFVDAIQQFQLDVAATGSQSYVTGSSVMGVLSGDDWKSNDIDIVCEGNASTIKAARALFERLGMGPKSCIRDLAVHNSLHAERTQINHVYNNDGGVTNTPTSSSSSSSVSSNTKGVNNDDGSPQWTTSIWRQHRQRVRSPRWTPRHYERFMAYHKRRTNYHEYQSEINDWLYMIDDLHMTEIDKANKEKYPDEYDDGGGGEEEVDDGWEDDLLPCWSPPDNCYTIPPSIHTRIMGERDPTAAELHVIAATVMKGVAMTYNYGDFGDYEADDYAKHSRSIYYSMNLYGTCHCPPTQCICAPMMRMDVLFIPGNDCVMAGGLFGWMDRNCDADITVNGISPAGLRCYAPHYFESRSMFYRTDTYCLIPDPKTMKLIENDDRPPPVIGDRKRVNCNCPRIHGRITKYQDRGFTLKWLSYAAYERHENEARQRTIDHLRNPPPSSAASLPAVVSSSHITSIPGGPSIDHRDHKEAKKISLSSVGTALTNPIVQTPIVPSPLSLSNQVVSATAAPAPAVVTALATAVVPATPTPMPSISMAAVAVAAKKGRKKQKKSKAKK